MLPRKAISDLNSWLSRSNRKPLIIRGARQVGKSTLVRIFSKQKKLQLLELNLDIVLLKSLKDETLQPEKLFLEIEAHFDCKLNPEILLFFDEIQKYPKMISALRYFYELRPEVPVIAAGSLLEFVLTDHDFEMPVGRIEYLHLGPMTFSEYLDARKKKILWSQVSEAIQKNRAISEAQHHQLSEIFREFLFVGGMPEAVNRFLETKDPKEARRVHQSILETYKDDFPKYTTKASLNYLNTVFERVPSIIGQKIKYSEISTDLASREIKKALELLKLARIIHCCYHTNASGLPLSAQKDESVLKIYFLDVGLYNSLMGLSWTHTQDYDDYAILTKGTMAEQFIGQHLAYRSGDQTPPSLYYWLRDKQKNNAELDFLVEADGEILPIEVKAGESGKMKSLVQFAYEKNIHRAVRLDLKYRDHIEEKMRYQLKNSQTDQYVQIILKNYHLGLVEII